jgi:uroporphyrin-3 C-methyltransferase
MNESPTSLNAQNAHGADLPRPVLNAPSGTAIDAAGARTGIQKSPRWVVVALVALALLIIGSWYFNQMAAYALRDETARHLKAGELGTTETKLLVKSLTDTVRELQAKVAVLESKQVEGQSQQLALEQLYQDLSKNRDDWALAEIEQVLSTASQQLQLAGNVPGALIALNNADVRLSRSDKPQFIVIRRAIGHDIDRLKALPSLDLTGIALRLDSLIGQIDNMPLLSDEKPVIPFTQPKKSSRPSLVGSTTAAIPTTTATRPVAVVTTKRHDRHERYVSEAAQSAKPTEAMLTVPDSTSGNWWYGLEDKWHSWSNEMWTEIRQLIRVRTVDTPDALLMSPTQAYYVRENLKLRLLNARLALLSRNEATFRNDMLASQDAITKYFDTRARQTQAAQALMRQVQSSNLAIDLPSLTESLNAVRNYKAKP